MFLDKETSVTKDQRINLFELNVGNTNNQIQ